MTAEEAAEVLADGAAELERLAKPRLFTPGRACFAAQQTFVESTARRQCACLARRTGKTTGVGIKLLAALRTPPYANVGYATISLKNAKRLVWPVLKQLNREYDLGGVVNESEGVLRFPALAGEPAIYLGGVNDRGEIDKIRGWAGGVKLWVVDEGQSVRQMLMQELVDDVIEPSLFDYDGVLAIIGTPGPLRAGYFYDVAAGRYHQQWEQFSWGMAENPWLERKSGKPVAELQAELRERRGWTVDNPTYRREYLGEWVDDPGALMLHYDGERNDCAWMREPRPGWQYVIGFDVGHDDADAIAVLGWQPHDPTVYLCDELLTTQQGVTALGEQLGAYYRRFRPIAMPGDFGGLGKKIGVELQGRWALPVEAADKVRKAEHVALLDDALRTGRLKAPRDSRFAQDCAIMQWDAARKAAGVLVADDAAHSDAIDSLLYAYRRCHGYLETVLPAPIERSDAEHQAMFGRAIAEVQRKHREREEDSWL